jgi:hypothetical protein
MKRFGFDLDGVLYNWYRAVYDHVTYSGGDQKGFVEFWQDAIDGRDGRGELYWKNLTETPIYYNILSPSKGVVDTLQTLSKSYDILYITHRPKLVERVTRNWLSTYNFPNPQEVYFTKHPKDVAVREFDCDLYIEDRGDILRSNLRYVTTLIAKRTYWNWKECEELPYVDEIPELVELLKEIN